ncbi:hypothetical protein QDD76_002584 [Burkholderia cepacia]|nr:MULTISPECIES: hypothetical protein [Burkholderia]EKS9793793.1 hypothetical protein [Burkholderia cepacia]EKS9804588.1 hypothetical protein [Burkholderia cepacia]EKS9811138.1 hypothetical protein [Burkholderia cepacia]EKS9818761.1 hypothetical protein [Burkholderia cepacia]EKS9829248.1 hypothetical protein [Burkholderia cepacia]
MALSYASLNGRMAGDGVDAAPVATSISATRIKIDPITPFVSVGDRF